MGLLRGDSITVGFWAVPGWRWGCYRAVYIGSVPAEDIAVVFRKESWEARADFSQADVHRQVAIVLRTPPFCSLQLQEPVQVEVFLQRLTDRARSRGCPYTYLPREQGARGPRGVMGMLWG